MTYPGEIIKQSDRINQNCIFGTFWNLHGHHLQSLLDSLQSLLLFSINGTRQHADESPAPAKASRWLTKISPASAKASQRLTKISPESAKASQRITKISPESAKASQRLTKISPESAKMSQRLTKISPVSANESPDRRLSEKQVIVTMSLINILIRISITNL